MGELIVLADYKVAKRLASRRAVKRAALASGEFFVGASFLAALAWVNACEDAAELFMVPWPGGIDDLPV